MGPPLIPSNLIPLNMSELMESYGIHGVSIGVSIGVSMGPSWSSASHQEKPPQHRHREPRPATSPRGAQSKPGVDATNVLMCGVFVPSESFI